MTQREDTDVQKWISTLDKDVQEGINRLDKDTQEWLCRDAAEAADRQRQAAPFAAGNADLGSIRQNPLAVALVRARSRGKDERTPRIPIFCPRQHNSTHAVVLHVEDEIDEGTPVEPTIEIEVHAGRAGSAEGPPMAGGSWTFVCGDCGQRTTMRGPKLLEAALAALHPSGNGHRIRLI